MAAGRPAWEALLPDSLVLARRTVVEAGKLLSAARAAAEHGDWKAIERILADAKVRFADHPWVIDVLTHMAKLAKAKDAARFRKEATYSGRKMSTRLSSKFENVGSVADEAAAPSFVRRKTAQGKAQFDKGLDDRGRETRAREARSLRSQVLSACRNYVASVAEAHTRSVSPTLPPDPGIEEARQATRLLDSSAGRFSRPCSSAR